MLVPTQTPMNCFCQKPNNLKVVFTVATAIIGGQKHRQPFYDLTNKSTKYSNRFSSIQSEFIQVDLSGSKSI